MTAQNTRLLQIHDLQESINETAEQRSKEKAEAEKLEELAEYANITELFNEIRSYYWEHVHLMVEVEYDILTAWTLTTWIPEKFNECAYPMFRGPKNSGKTRALNTQAQLTYNAKKTSKITIAALYRLLDKGIHTFIMDEFDHYSREKR